MKVWTSLSALPGTKLIRAESIDKAIDDSRQPEPGLPTSVLPAAVQDRLEKGENVRPAEIAPAKP